MQFQDRVNRLAGPHVKNLQLKKTLWIKRWNQQESSCAISKRILTRLAFWTAKSKADLVKECQVEALELFRVELQGWRRGIAGETLKLLDEVSALGQRDPSAPPPYLDAGLGRRLLSDGGDQAVGLHFGLEVNGVM